MVQNTFTRAATRGYAGSMRFDTTQDRIRLAALIQSLMSGGMAPDDWQRRILADLRALHTEAAGMARGGRPDVDGSDVLYMEGAMRFAEERIQRLLLVARRGEECDIDEELDLLLGEVEETYASTLEDTE